jgi:hypothetical protein
MAGFSLKSNLGEVEYRKVRVASQAYTIGDAVMRDTTSDAVDVVPATSSTSMDTLVGVAMETVTSAATELLIAIIEPSQKWECEVANTVSANHNYQKMVLTDANTVNNTGTDSVADAAICMQVGVSGTKAIFQFRGDAT